MPIFTESSINSVVFDIHGYGRIKKSKLCNAMRSCGLNSTRSEEWHTNKLLTKPAIPLYHYTTHIHTRVLTFGTGRMLKVMNGSWKYSIPKHGMLLNIIKCNFFFFDFNSDIKTKEDQWKYLSSFRIICVSSAFCVFSEYLSADLLVCFSFSWAPQL
jgi:hypothetical protein